jgi:hypothetical protein
MALANVAVLLCRRGKKVLAIDWDLEAPGLPRYFANLKSNQDGEGLLALLLRHRDGQSSGGDYKSYLWKVQDTDARRSFDVLSSGHEIDPEYSKSLERFDWHEFFRRGGGDFFEKLRAEWKIDYDIVLIDSRTGLTDSGGICTIQLPDIVVGMFTANNQSLYGVRDVMRLAQQGRQRLSFDRMSLNVIPLASRFGTRSEFRESKRWLDEFATTLEEFFAEWLPSSSTPRQVIEKMKIPQVDYFSFGERLAVLEDSSSNSEGMTPSYNMLADLIESDYRNLPEVVTNIHITDFRKYFVVSRTFGDSPADIEFIDATRQLAHTLVISIKETPPFDPKWAEVSGNEAKIAELLGTGKVPLALEETDHSPRK